MPSIILILCCLQAASAQRAEFRYEKRDRDLTVYRMFLNGRRTPLAMEASSNAVGPPEADCHRTGKGILYGSAWRVESGAISVSENVVFIKDKGRFLTKSGFQVKGHQGETLLLEPVQGGPWAGASHAYLYERGRFIDLGLAQEVGFGKGGKVVGWYYSLANGNAAQGIIDEVQEPVFKQYFEFHRGIRTLKGRSQVN